MVGPVKSQLSYLIDKMSTWKNWKEKLKNET